MPSIQITLDDENCMPYKAYPTDAGWDLKSRNKDFVLKPGSKITVNTGVYMAVPKRHVGLIFPRSGLGTKHRVGLANTVGVIDADYRGEIKVFLVNDGNDEVEIKQYDRFAQIVIVPVSLDKLREVKELPKTARGTGGFGHSGGR